MIFTLTLNLEPGVTFADIQKQIAAVAGKLPDADCKPEHPHRIGIDTSAPGFPYIRGEWAIEPIRRSPQLAALKSVERFIKDQLVTFERSFEPNPTPEEELQLQDARALMRIVSEAIVQGECAWQRVRSRHMKGARS